MDSASDQGEDKPVPALGFAAAAAIAAVLLFAIAVNGTEVENDWAASGFLVIGWLPAALLAFRALTGRQAYRWLGAALSLIIFGYMATWMVFQW